MSKVTVYKVKVYNIATDASMISRRWATREGADRMSGWVIEESAVEIDDTQLEKGEQWTERGFEPHRGIGFQKQVRHND